MNADTKHIWAMLAVADIYEGGYVYTLNKEYLERIAQDINQNTESQVGVYLLPRDYFGMVPVGTIVGARVEKHLNTHALWVDIVVEPETLNAYQLMERCIDISRYLHGEYHIVPQTTGPKIVLTRAWFDSDKSHPRQKRVSFKCKPSMVEKFLVDSFHGHLVDDLSRSFVVDYKPAVTSDGNYLGHYIFTIEYVTNENKWYQLVIPVRFLEGDDQELEARSIAKYIRKQFGNYLLATPKARTGITNVYQVEH